MKNNKIKTKTIVVMKKSMKRKLAVKSLSPKDTKVETQVIMQERSREPPSRCVHMLEAPPPGQQPLRNIPRRISRSSKESPGYSASPRPKEIWRDRKRCEIGVIL